MNAELQSIMDHLGIPLSELAGGEKQSSGLAGAMEVMRLYSAFDDEKRQKVLAFARVLAAGEPGPSEAAK
jgi:hypothetical protein